MPSKASYLFFFIGTSVVLISAQAFVFFQLRRLIRRDFPHRAKKAVPVIRWIFIAMNLPILFLFFRRNIQADVSLLTNIMLYPFTIWQFLILLWTLVLLPVVIIRVLRRKKTRNILTPENVKKET